MQILLRSKQSGFYGSFLFEVNYGGDAKQILLLLVFNLSCVQIYVYWWLLCCAASDVAGSGREAPRCLRRSVMMVSEVIQT